LAVFTAFNILANYKFPLNEALCFKEESVNVVELNKYFQTALLFNIPKGLKRLSYQISKSSLLVQAVFYSEPVEFEIDCIHSTTSEVLGNYSDEFNSSVCTKIEKECTKIPDLDNLIFARYDAEEY